MRFSDSCPACTQRVRWHHVIANPSAPFYFRCPSCRARLRLKTPGDVFMVLAVALAVYVGWVLVVLGVTALVPNLGKVMVLILTGSAAAIVGVVIVLAITFKGGMLRVREEGVLADAERGYFAAVILGLLTLLVLALVLGYIGGHMTGFIEDLVRQLRR